MPIHELIICCTLYHVQQTSATPHRSPEVSKNSTMNHENHETRFQSFTSSCASSTFAFVCSVLGFCLQRAEVLFAACNSFVCSVQKFCLQRVIILFAACRSFVSSVLEFCLQREIHLLVVCIYVFTLFFGLQCAGDDFFDVLFMFARNYFYLQYFLFVKVVSPVGHRTKGTKQGHSGQKGRKGTSLSLCFSLGARGISRGRRARGLTENKSCLAYETEFRNKLSTHYSF